MTNLSKIYSGQKNKNHVTKRGHYLDDLGKLKKLVPAPNKYEVGIKWADPKEKGKRPTSAPPKRYSHNSL